MGTGVLLYKYATPSDEELIAAFSPEIRAEYERNRALRQQEQQELMKIAVETSNSKDPIWKTGKIKSPFERDSRGVDPQLVDKNQFFIDETKKLQRLEVEQARLELEEKERLVQESKNLWFSWRR